MASRISINTNANVADERTNPNQEVLPNENMLLPEYKLLSKIGAGGHGAVYEIVDSNNQIFALKVQKVSRTGLQLKEEFDIYNTLLMNAQSGYRTPGIPWVYGYKEYEGLEYMIMERLGDNLDQVAERHENKQLAKADVLMIGIQAVKRLRDLHENGILHRDVKPENMAIGNGRNTERTVHIIDFGLAMKVDDWATYDYNREVAFAGTKYYASAEALLNKAPTRKGDLECLAYSLLSLACGGLPWQYNHPVSGRPFRDCEMGVQRLLFKPFLCCGFPYFKGFFEAVSSTERTEKPDYEHFVTLLEAAFLECRIGNTGEPKRSDTVNESNRYSSIRPKNKQQADRLTPDVLKTPPVPPGFGFKAERREEGSVIRVRIPPKNTSNVQAAKSMKRHFMRPGGTETTSTGIETHSALHRDSKVCAAPIMEQSSDGDNSGTLLDSDCSAVSTIILINTRKPGKQSRHSPVKNESGILPYEVRPRIPQREHSCHDIQLFFTLLLIMVCCLKCMNQRQAMHEGTEITQRIDDKASKLTAREEVKAEHVSEIVKVSECEGDIREEQETMKAMAGCDTAIPNLLDARSERKRDFLKRKVSKGISRAVRTITGPVASKFVRPEGLRS